MSKSDYKAKARELVLSMFYHPNDVAMFLKPEGMNGLQRMIGHREAEAFRRDIEAIAAALQAAADEARKSLIAELSADYGDDRIVRSTETISHLLKDYK